MTGSLESVLYNLRALSGQNMAEMAQSLGTTVEYLHGIEAGDEKPPSGFLGSLALAYSMSDEDVTIVADACAGAGKQDVTSEGHTNV